MKQAIFNPLIGKEGIMKAFLPEQVTYPSQ
jgi:hypothetical protein